MQGSIEKEKEEAQARYTVAELDKQAIWGYGTNTYATKIIDGLLKVLNVAAALSLDFTLLYWINGLRSALKKSTEKK